MFGSLSTQCWCTWFWHSVPETCKQCHRCFLSHHLKLMRILMVLYMQNNQSTLQICSCHDSYAVETWANLWLDWINKIMKLCNYLKANPCFTRFRLWAPKPFTKWGPDMLSVWLCPWIVRQHVIQPWYTGHHMSIVIMSQGHIPVNHVDCCHWPLGSWD